MDEDAFKKLTDRHWVGQQIAKFWKDHGGTKELAVKAGLTNLWRYEKEGVVPRWEQLIRIAQACDSTLEELISYIDPAAAQIDGLEIAPEHRKQFEMLATILECRDNQRRIDGITVNLEEFSKAASREMDEKAQRPQKQGSGSTRASPSKPRPASSR